MSSRTASGSSVVNRPWYSTEHRATTIRTVRG
jgi:hypothetical protein